MVMVAERNDAGMRRRARRDQNDREEKAETMRRESGTNLDFLSGARGRVRTPQTTHRLLPSASVDIPTDCQSRSLGEYKLTNTRYTRTRNRNAVGRDDY